MLPARRNDIWSSPSTARRRFDSQPRACHEFGNHNELKLDRRCLLLFIPALCSLMSTFDPNCYQNGWILSPGMQSRRRFHRNRPAGQQPIPSVPNPHVHRRGAMDTSFEALVTLQGAETRKGPKSGGGSCQRISRGSGSFSTRPGISLGVLIRSSPRTVIFICEGFSLRGILLARSSVA